MVSLVVLAACSCHLTCFVSFYCIVLLTTLFVSSCYWQPFPLDSPLATPWSENITTFADALKASLPINYNPGPTFPSVMRAVDRCWCEFTGSFFEPFNVSHWEYLSVIKVSQDLQRRRKAAVQPEVVLINKQETHSPVYDPNKDSQDSTISNTFRNFLFFPFSLQTSNRVDSLPLSQDVPLAEISISDGPSTGASIDVRTSIESPTLVPGTFPTNNKGKEYDLRPYGLGLVVDLGW